MHMTPALSAGDALLDRVVAGTSILDSLHAGAALRALVTAGGSDRTDQLLDSFATADEFARLLLLPSIAQIEDPAADAVLVGALHGPSAAEREHAAWALGDRAVLPAATPALEALRSAGGFGAMLSELTQDTWAAPPRPVAMLVPPRRGLRIVQVFMQGYLDAGLTRAGAGDGGGLATLLVHLSAALAARPEVEHVTTLTRGFSGAGVPAVHALASEPIAPGASLERLPFGGDGYLATAEMWPHRRELERGLEAALTRLAPDVVHLRFADVASLAAARVCERLGLPVYFTLAPDPHGLLRRREAAGTLDRRGFVAADRVEHLLFRARLVERLRDQSAGLALLPRGSGREELWELVRLPRHAPGRRVRTVAEGISLAGVDGAASSTPAPMPALPAARRGLPMILSVGRLHRVKGFATLLEAWGGDPELREGFNLAIVGGDLEHPTGEERTVLEGLRGVLDRHPAARDGLLLLGHRRHQEVLELMAAAGLPAGSTRARARRRSSAWRCWRRWRAASRSSGRRWAGRRRSSRTA